MADTDQMIDDGTSEGGGSKKKKIMTLAIALGLVLGEGGAIFVITRMVYKQPASAEAGEMSAEQQAMQAAKESVEIQLPEVNAFNKREGRLFMYNLQASVMVQEERSEEIKEILDLRQSTILDRFNTVIRSADVKFLNEPGLDTLRRQFRFELDKILGDDSAIQELLIPRFYQSAADL